MCNTKIKICGITKPDELEFLRLYGVDYIGMVMYYPKSKRNIDISTASELLDRLHSDSSNKIKPVAVVVSPDIKEVEEIAETGFSFVQVHGDVPVGVDKVFERYPGFKMWKAFNNIDNDEINKYKDISYIDAFVFDAAQPGSGKVFDWNSLNDIDMADKRMVLAGGLNCENVKSAIEMLHPDIVDVSSGVEIAEDEEIKEIKHIYTGELGLKNPIKVKRFADAVRG